jgi:bifunctional non-homologous end joining protein LigD
VTWLAHSLRRNQTLHLPHFTSANAVLRRDAFDHPDYIFELKHDGFRALAYVDKDGTQLVSRRGNVYRSFPRLCDSIRLALKCDVVLDGEVVCLDSEGRPQFYELLRRRGQPVFYVFDLLWLDGEDLRERPLIERKQVLRSLVPEQSSSLLYADHIEQHGVEFFRLTCDRDLEGRSCEMETRRIRSIVVEDSEPQLFTVRRKAPVV